MLSPLITYLLGFRGFELLVITTVGFLILYLFVLPFVLGFADPARLELRSPNGVHAHFSGGPRDKDEAHKPQA